MTPVAALNARLSSFSMADPVRLPMMLRPPKIRSAVLTSIGSRRRPDDDELPVWT
ncbi:hypothetical protein [Mycolicibacterium mageritense]|uniref:hypothetical protein n=1 Tax=Mycolicibacterium mageritense TaxID=53462 RepID=UPI001E3E0A06|nr:hypothetical protein [Mycolicibacterium mageritense]